MKKLLLSLLCIVTIISCNDDFENVPENASEDLSAKAASDVHVLDRSLTTPLWEYVTVSPTPKGFKDYYYTTGDNPNLSITVNRTTYQRVRQIGRIFKNNIGYPYNYSPDYNNVSFPLVIWYSPTMKRHRVLLGYRSVKTLESTVSYPDFGGDISASDYYQVNILGYVPNYISVKDRAVYQKAGMLEPVYEHRNSNTTEFRIGTTEWFINNYGRLSWFGINELGFMYLK